MINDDLTRRIIIHFPEDVPLYRVSDIKAVTETYWQANQRHNYVVTAELEDTGHPPFRITVNLSSDQPTTETGRGVGLYIGRETWQDKQNRGQRSSPQGAAGQPALFSGGG